MDMGEMLGNGLQLMGIGVGIVFFVLGLFFLITKLLVKIWPAK
jgi:Na+-transporting methylmalonyl-CoA/oxaloacetate decarboxylase gamma subunit